MEYDRFIELKEDAKHGDYMLPVALYWSIIPDFFTSYPMHWHEEVEILYIVEGKLDINLDLKTYTAKEGDIVFMSPCALHSFKQHENVKTRFVNLVFHMRILGTSIPDACTVKYLRPFMESEYEYNPVINSENENYEAIKSCFLNFKRECDLKEEFYELKIKSEIFNLFYLLFNSVLIKKESSKEVSGEAIQNIKMILDYIQENYKEVITVEELAKLLNFSKSHFMRYFKKYMGITCIEYINQYRLNRAANLLTTTDLTVTEIAEEVGISNLSYFNRQFKRFFDVSPLQHRKKIDINKER